MDGRKSGARGDQDAWIPVGVVQSVQAQRRELRVKARPGRGAAIVAQDVLLLERANGGTLRCKVLHARETERYCLIVLVPGVPRDTVAELAGARVLGPKTAVARDGAVPLDLEALRGLRVVDEDGAAVGKVSALYDGKAHAIVEIRKPEGGALTIPVIPETVLDVDLGAGVITVGALAPYSVHDED